MMETAYMTTREVKIAMNKKRRNRIVRRQRVALAFFITGIIMLILFLVFTVKLEAHDEKVEQKCYAAVDVMPGDTLLGISDGYFSPSHYHDVDSYLEEVKSINHFDDNYTITPDRKVILPYYSY